MSRRRPNEPGDLEGEAAVLVARVRGALRAKAEAAGLRTLEEKTARGRGYLSHLFSGAIKNLTLQQVFELLLALEISPVGFFVEVLGEGSASAGGLSRTELIDLVDAYMQRRSAAAPKPATAKKPRKPKHGNGDEK